MARVAALGRAVSDWIDDVTSGVSSGLKLGRSRLVEVAEARDGTFVLSPGEKHETRVTLPLHVADGAGGNKDQAQQLSAIQGRSVGLTLRPDLFLFSTIELPLKATDFLEGVVRGQIDRLTPWHPDSVVFGWSDPVEAGVDRVAITIAVAPRASIEPYIAAFSRSGASNLVLKASYLNLETGQRDELIVRSQWLGQAPNAGLRSVVVRVLAVFLLIGVSFPVAAEFVSDSLQSQQDDLARRIAERRAAVLKIRDAAVDPQLAVQRQLERKKRETASSVIVIEVLSRILPDHTYVTELRIDADKIRLVGSTSDAPGLIRLLEQSQYFASAAFFAPTTRGAADAADRFSIEARLVPRFSI